MMKYSFLLLIFLFLSSCYTPKHVLHDTLNNSDKILVNKNSTFVLTKNNFPFYAVNFNAKVDKDFKSILGNNLTFKQDYLDLDTNSLINRFFDENELKQIKEETESDYLILLKTILKPSFSENNSKEKGFPKVKREYHIILEMYDLTNYKRIYTKESTSLLEYTFDGVAVSKTQVSQLNKTFDVLMDDFKKQVKK